MASARRRFGWVVVLGLMAGSPANAQLAPAVEAQDEAPVRPSGPAAKKADELIRAYIARIEKEVDQSRKEVDRLRAELHELIDIRSEIASAIAELRGELATLGTYSAAPLASGQVAAQEKTPGPPAQEQRMMRASRDLFYGLGSALPKDPTPEQREQLRRLAPRADLNRMVERLREEVEETRGEVDRLTYKLLELRAGVSESFGPYGAMGGMGGGMGVGGMRYRGTNPWFGTIATPIGMGGMR
jgi:chorismate mutase